MGVGMSLDSPILKLTLAKTCKANRTYIFENKSLHCKLENKFSQLYELLACK